MPTIIRKSNYTDASTSSEAANRNAVTQLTNNKAITVTPKRVALPPVNNSITVSPIINSSNPTVKKPNVSNAQPQVVLSKVNSPTNRTSSPIVPVAITKTPQPLILNNARKTGSPKSPILASRNLNNVRHPSPKTATPPRLINGSPSQMPAPKIIVHGNPLISTTPNVSNNKKVTPPRPTVRVTPSNSKNPLILPTKRPQNLSGIQPLKRAKLSLGSTSAPTVKFKFV